MLILLLIMLAFLILITLSCNRFNKAMIQHTAETCTNPFNTPLPILLHEEDAPGLNAFIDLYNSKPSGFFPEINLVEHGRPTAGRNVFG